REEGKEIGKDVNHLVTMNLFITITNANFDREAIIRAVEETLECKQKLLEQVNDPSGLPEAAFWKDGRDSFDSKAVSVGVLATENEDIRSLRELITYGLKGLAAYTKHANALLQDNEEVDSFIQS
ncbi:MAG TPA: hydroxylamine reductase, partial [Lachnospiraceae bacterium]|nr:hydroxylamine reductase [Lachnospiraceae bacterium]